jgi:tRNA modification GTPase
VLFVIDGTSDLTENEENIRRLEDKKTIFIINKTDSPKFHSDIKKQLGTIVSLSNYAVCEISALRQDGIEKFNEIFQQLLIDDGGIQADAVITNVRHAELLEDALTHICDAADPIRDGVLDIGAFELRDALDRIGEITGAVTREDVLNRIFEKFCVGK